METPHEEMQDEAPPPPPDDEAVQEALAELRRQDDAERFTPPQQVDVPSGYVAPVAPRRGYIEPIPAAARGMATPMIGSDGLAQLALPKEPKTLEDLYAVYPKVGDGYFRIRIERTAPKIYNGRQVAGWLDDLDEPIPMSEFSSRYGGGKYTVSVMGPIRPPREGADPPPIRRLKHIEVQVPGNPTLASRDISPEEMYAMQQVPYQRTAMSAENHPDVAKRKIDVDQERWVREQDERERREEQLRLIAAQQAKGSEGYVAAIQQANQLAVEKVESTAKDATAILREQLAEARATISTKDADLKLLNEQIQAERKEKRDVDNEIIRRLREEHQSAYDALRKDKDAEINRLKADMESTVSNLKMRLEQETKALRDATDKAVLQVREEKQTEISRAREEAASAVKELTAQHRNDLQMASSRYTEELTRATTSHLGERAKLESDSAKERERIMNDAARRETQLKDEFERDRRAVKETYEQRIADVDRSAQREITSLKETLARETQALKDTRDREVESLKAQYSMKADLAEKTSSMRVENSVSEMARIRAELESIKSERDGYRREAEQLRIASHKDPVTAISEAQTLAQLVGWGPPSEEKAAPEEDGDWKKMAARGLSEGIKKLAENAPDVIDKIASMRSQGAQQQAQAAEMQMRMQFEQQRRAEIAQMQQMQMQQYGGMAPPPALEAPQQQQQRPLPNRARPQQQQQQQIPPMSSAPIGSGSTYIPINQPPPIGGGMPPLTSVSPIQPDMPPPASLQPVVAPPQPQQPLMQPQPPLMQPQPQQAPAPRPQTQQPQPQGEPQVSPEAVMTFLGGLESAISMGVVTPQMFAQGFIEKVGPQTGRELLGSIRPQELLDKIAATPDGANTAIVTRMGQKFVHQLWAETDKILRGMGA